MKKRLGANGLNPTRPGWDDIIRRMFEEAMLRSPGPDYERCVVEVPGGGLRRLEAFGGCVRSVGGKNIVYLESRKVSWFHKKGRCGLVADRCLSAVGRTPAAPWRRTVYSSVPCPKPKHWPPHPAVLDVAREVKSRFRKCEVNAVCAFGGPVKGNTYGAVQVECPGRSDGRRATVLVRIGLRRRRVL